MPLSLRQSVFQRPTGRLLLQCLCFVLAFCLLADAALADLPNAPNGAGAGTTDYIASFKTYSGQAVALLILIVGAAIFVVVAWLAIQALIEAVNGRGNWAGVILLGVVGSAVLVFDLFLLNVAKGIFNVAVA